jgi:ribonuclease D
MHFGATGVRRVFFAGFAAFVNNSPTRSRGPALSVDGTPVDLVTGNAELREVCARWSLAPVIGVDTEFFRERTYYPCPALVQVADAEGIVLVDPLGMDDLSPLADVFTAPQVVKIMHACSEDLEVLELLTGSEPNNVFDSQLAGAFAGHGFSLGYRALVETLLGVTLDKDATRSDWLRRPLSPAQLRYATLDVAYLLPVYERLHGALASLGRLDWLNEEFSHWLRARGNDKRPDSAFLKVRDRERLDPEDHAVLRALAEWREREAMRRDIPRRYVLPDAALVDIAASRPASSDALASLDSVSPRAAKRYAKAVVECIVAAGENPPGDADRPVDLQPHAGTIKRLKRIVKTQATVLNLPPELLAHRRALEGLLRGVLAGGEANLPPGFLGWRSEAITHVLLETIHESR